jgi:hypothetical protein
MFYVSVIDAGRTGLVLGPFDTEAECRAWAYRDSESGGDARLHDRLVKAACDCTGGRAWFYAWGMVRVEGETRPGVLNHLMDSLLAEPVAVVTDAKPRRRRKAA